MSSLELNNVQLEAVAELFGRLVDLSADEQARALADDSLDAVVRQQVGELLGQELDPVFEDQAIDAVRGTLLEEEAARTTPEYVGPYRVLDKLGEGGMGVVYRAQQSEPVEREVAVKLIRIGRGSPALQARLEAERQALALMDHPFIAKVFDGGAALDGSPYLVMELVHGLPLTEFCDRKRLAVDDRLRLFVHVCQAVHHAHQKGVIHRDIKPTNVLVAEHGGDALPKVIDFGVAKALESPLTKRALVTEIETLVGTPQYMAPEQIAGRDVDTRVDVYALGVMLYELLVGVRPFDVSADEDSGALDYHQLLSDIRERDPQRPSTQLSVADRNAMAIAERRMVDAQKLRGQVRGDLDWIVVRALEKERDRRYDSAAALAEDVLRHLRDEPVEARPPSRRYRIGKLVRRNRGLVVASALGLFALVGGVVGTAWGWRESLRANDALSDSLVAEADARAAAEQQLVRADEAKKFLIEMLASAEPAVALGMDTDLLRYVLGITAKRLDEGAVTDPLIQTELQFVIGATLIDIDDPVEALKHLDAALETASTDPLDENRLRVEVGRLAALGKAHRFEETRSLYRTLHPKLVQVFGARSIDALRASWMVGVSEVDAGRPQAAAELVEKLLEDAVDELAASTELSIDILRLAASVYSSIGDYQRVYESAVEILAAEERQESPDQLRLLYARTTLLDALNGLGRRAEALALAEEIYRGFAELFGDHDVLTLHARGNMAMLLAGTERNAEAVTILEEVCSHSAWNPEDQRRLSLIPALGGARAMNGDVEGGIEALEEGLRLFESSTGRIDSAQAFMVRTNLVNLYSVAGRYEDSVTAGEELAAQLAERFGSLSPQVLSIRVQCLQALAYDEKSEQALAKGRELMPKLWQVLGDSNSDTALAEQCVRMAAGQIDKDGDALLREWREQAAKPEQPSGSRR